MSREEGWAAQRTYHVMSVATVPHCCSLLEAEAAAARSFPVEPDK